MNIQTLSLKVSAFINSDKSLDPTIWEDLSKEDFCNLVDINYDDAQRFISGQSGTINLIINNVAGSNPKHPGLVWSCNKMLDNHDLFVREMSSISSFLLKHSKENNISASDVLLPFVSDKNSLAIIAGHLVDHGMWIDLVKLFNKCDFEKKNIKLSLPGLLFKSYRSSFNHFTFKDLDTDTILDFFNSIYQNPILDFSNWSSTKSNDEEFFENLRRLNERMFLNIIKDKGDASGEYILQAVDIIIGNISKANAQSQAFFLSSIIPSLPRFKENEKRFCISIIDKIFNDDISLDVQNVIFLKELLSLDNIEMVKLISHRISDELVFKTYSYLMQNKNFSAIEILSSCIDKSLRQKALRDSLHLSFKDCPYLSSDIQNLVISESIKSEKLEDEGNNTLQDLSSKRKKKKM